MMGRGMGRGMGRVLPNGLRRVERGGGSVRLGPFCRPPPPLGLPRPEAAEEHVGERCLAASRFAAPPPARYGTGSSPALGQPTPGAVKQDKSSGGSVDTTETRSDPQRVRMSSGERPIGAAKGKRPDTEALCQTPPLVRSGRTIRSIRSIPAAHLTFGALGHWCHFSRATPVLRMGGWGAGASTDPLPPPLSPGRKTTRFGWFPGPPAALKTRYV